MKHESKRNNYFNGKEKNPNARVTKIAVQN